jgi:hypothetical protein
MSDTPATARHANGRFGPGNPGRRAGARNRVSHRAAMAILDDFELHKEELLNRLRIYHAPAYFAILTRLLDRELRNETPALEDYDDIELARTVALARSALTLDQSPRDALIELEGVLVGRSSLDPTADLHRINGDLR